jgi:molybdate transport system ATP-binding protein
MIKLKINKTLKAPGGTFKLNLDFAINQGDFITIYGPSGAGKTTLLRTIAGLIKPETGIITHGDSTWFDSAKNIHLKPQQRPVGLVFQDYALFPNMTVAQNIHYALARNGDKQKVDELVKLLKLKELINRKPDDLSGGQKQRVSLARSLVNMPQVLLLDEPMAALDLEIRHKIQNYLLEVHKLNNHTTILVSHDIGEIFKLSDQVIMLEEGTLTSQGTPADIFNNKEASGDFQLAGEVLKISKEQDGYLITVLMNQQIIKVPTKDPIGNQFAIGDKVIISAQSFNPTIRKLS